ncbi:MAG: hypothetical protein ACI8QI_001184 [Limisphaerales bacterium]|jgi:hypothetical protein
MVTVRFDTPLRFAGVAVILASLVVAALVNAEEASQSSSIVLTPDEKRSASPIRTAAR